MRLLYEFGRFTLDPEEHRLTLDGVQVPVTPKAFDILVVLVQRAPRLVSKDQLMKEVWPDAYVEEANLAVHISALRRTLGDAAEQKKYIETVPRRGYRFVVPVRESRFDEEVATQEDLRVIAESPAEAPDVPHTPFAESEDVIRKEDTTPPPVAASSDAMAVDTRATGRSRWPLVGAIAVLTIALISWGLTTLSPSLARRHEFAWETIATEGRLQRLLAAEAGATDPALSADGRMLAYVLTDQHGQADLYVTRVGGEGQLRLTNDTQTETWPRFSPDGDRLLFTRLDRTMSAPEIRVIPVLGGQSKLVTHGLHHSWSPKGDRIAFVATPQPDSLPALYTSTVDGTDVKEIMPPSAAYPFVRHTSWSPDGNHIAVVRGTGGIAGEVWLVPANGGEPRRVTHAPAEVFAENPVFTPDGSGIIYTSNRGGAWNLWVQMFETNRSVRLTTGPGHDNFATVAADGTVVFLSSRNREELIVHSPGDDITRSLLSHSPYLWAPVFSPDGKEITFSRSELDGSWQIWSMSADGEQAPRQLTSGALGAIHPRYTPDGQSIIYHSWGAPRRIYRVPRTGGSPVQIPLGDYEDGYADPSPDGQSLAFARTDGAERVHIAPLLGGTARPLTSRPSSVPRWAPDGKLIAFSPNRSYTGGIFVIAPDGSGERRLTDVGGWPAWWPDGKQISYIAIGPDSSQQLWTVSVEGGPARLMKDLTFAGRNYPFDIAQDGRRLVTSRQVRMSREIWLLEKPGDN
jgi:Tol biopolymer transport system component/DNA-binding winged helix-turn-helix (wHTH) protein